MKAEQRRRSIADMLLTKQEPIAGGELSKMFGVSRQIIVHDISLLKTRGFDILATHNGYILRGSPLVERVFKIWHTSEKTEDELNLIVENGGTVVDVYVWHKAYGKMEAKLNIGTKEQVAKFVENVRDGSSVELMQITGGYHYHTIRAENEAVLYRIEQALEKNGFLAPGQ